jgi:hypothetical protein
MSSLPYDPDKEKQKILAQQPYTNEWYRRVKDRVKHGARERNIPCTLNAAAVKQIFEYRQFTCYVCGRHDHELPDERLSLVRLDDTEGYTIENTETFCKDCQVRKNYTPPKKRKPKPAPPKAKPLWNFKDSPVKRIAYHAASRYYQRFHHRYINEAELTPTDIRVAEREIQQISFLWEKLDDTHYQYENAIFVVKGTTVITLYPKRQPQTKRIRHSLDYYRSVRE